MPPADTGLAPNVAIPKALGRAGLSISDIALWEINEAFASVPVAVTRELGIDDAIVNVLGHPVAMTGGGMATTLVLDVPAPRLQLTIFIQNGRWRLFGHARQYLGKWRPRVPRTAGLTLTPRIIRRG